jgi:hypothetical protein
VDLDEDRKLVAKTTKPPGFGLIPALLKLPVAVRPGESPRFRHAIEFIPATPIEYLVRWQMNNEVFGDDVRLESVIQWQDGRVSFGISQPQYQGEPADPRDIEEYFTNNGWAALNDPSGHRVFYHYGFQVMAIDAESRNCYLTVGGLQPFDVILFKPNEEMECYLNVFPE